MAKTRVHEWFSRFENGDYSLEDQSRSERRLQRTEQMKMSRKIQEVIFVHR